MFLCLAVRACGALSSTRSMRFDFFADEPGSMDAAIEPETSDVSSLAKCDYHVNGALRMLYISKLS